MKKIISLENTKQTFIDNPDVSLLSPHMRALRTLIETHSNERSPSMQLVLPPFLSLLNTNTNTHTVKYAIQALTTALGL